jgi:cytochrome c peroxidase
MRHFFTYATAIACAPMGWSAVAAAQSQPVSVAADMAADMAQLRQLYSGQPATWPKPTLHDGAVFTEFGPLPDVVHPVDNPTSPEKVALGRALFNDPILSGSGQIACASCHHQELGFTDRLSRSFGHDRQRGRRNAQSILTVAWMTQFFWDGRASSLEEQAVQPLHDPIEMASHIPDIEARLRASPSYVKSFAAVFGSQPIQIDQAMKALASFMRAQRPRSKWDNVMRAGTQSLTDQQLQGLHLFRTKAGCANCHNGPLFTDQRFHNEGMSFYGRSNQDLGRYEFTKLPADVGAFRTPSLRGIGRTAPYMHMGAFNELMPVIRFYNMGGVHPKPTEEQKNDPLFPKTSSLLKPLNLTEDERQAILAFLLIL